MPTAKSSAELNLAMLEAMSSTEDKIKETAQHYEMDNYNNSLEAQQQAAVLIGLF